MADITIPPEALEAAARAIAQTTEPKDKWRYHIPEARAACIAMLRAWPGMGPIRTDQPIGDWCDKLPAIILPLSQEKQNG